MNMFVRRQRFGVAGKFSMLLFAALLVALGCVPPGGTVVEETPTVRVLTGLFGAETEDCPWVTSGVDRIYLLLPSTLKVNITPTEIRSANGTVIAKAGERIRVTGPSSAGVSACSPNPPFPVDTLERVGP